MFKIVQLIFDYSPINCLQIWGYFSFAYILSNEFCQFLIEEKERESSLRLIPVLICPRCLCSSFPVATSEGRIGQSQLHLLPSNLLPKIYLEDTERKWKRNCGLKKEKEEKTTVMERQVSVPDRFQAQNPPLSYFHVCPSQHSHETRPVFSL